MAERYPPQNLRQYFYNAATLADTDRARAVAHILCASALPEQQHIALPHLRVSLQGPSARMYTTATVTDWDGLLAAFANRPYDATHQLLSLARSLATGSPISVGDICHGLSCHHASIVAQAMLLASGRHTLHVLEPIVDPDMRCLTDVAYVLHDLIRGLALADYEKQLHALAPDDSDGITAAKQACNAVVNLIETARAQVLDRLTTRPAAAQHTRPV